MLEKEQDKKIVEKYKQTNKTLRQQLFLLNEQIDKLLIKRSNTVGLQKLPQVSKNLTDTKIIQHQIYNLKKRLQQLQHDNHLYKQKLSKDYNQELIALEQQLQQKNLEKQHLRMQIRIFERQDKIEFAKREESFDNRHYLEKIQRLNEQIIRNQKIQKDLRKQLSQQEVVHNKKQQYVTKLQEQYSQLQQKNIPKSIPQSLSHYKQIPNQQWVKLKSEFLELKDAKQKEEIRLYEQNDNLRREIKRVQTIIKQKKGRVEYLKSSGLKRQRNYSTLQHNNPKKQGNFRYRDRNNSLRYSGKTIQH